MPGRKHPLPKGAIGPHKSTEENAQLAQHGIAFLENLDLAILTLLTEPDWERRLDLAQNLLGPYLLNVFASKNQERLNQLVVSVERVAEHIRDGKAYDRNLLLAAQWIMDVRAKGEEPTKEGLHDFLDAQNPERDTFDESYIRKLLKKLGRPLAEMDKSGEAD